MTITTNSGFDTAAASTVVGVIELIELDFAQGTLYLTTWPVDIVIGTQTYTGVGDIGSVGQMRESEDGQTQTLPITLSQVKSANLSLALGNVSNYQGRGARVRLALSDANGVIQGTPVLRFSGFMDTVSIKRNGPVGEITLECATGGYDLRRNPLGLRMNDVQHQSRKPGELGFQYIQTLISNQQLWMSKAFQQSLSG